VKFTLTIDCDNAAFAPLNDDAGEAERYMAASDAVAHMLNQFAGDLLVAFAGQRSGFLRDSNGNRCGDWQLSDFDDDEEAEA
jgi:hypothetical protein